MTSRDLESTGKPTRLHESLEATQDPRWVLNHEGYNVLNESAVESGDAAAADTEHRELVSRIDRAARTGALHRNTAARKKARAARIRAGA